MKASLFFVRLVIAGVLVATGFYTGGVSELQAGEPVTDPIFRGNTNDLSSLAIDPFESRFTATSWGEWSSNNDGGQGRTNGFTTDFFGGSLGYDHKIGNYGILGFSLLGSNLEISPGDERYDGKIDSLAGKLHLSIFGDLWYIDFGAGTGQNETTSEFESGSWHWRNRYSTRQWNYDLDSGLRIRQGFTRIEPFLGFHVTSLNEPADAEDYPYRDSFFPTNDSANHSCRMFLGSRFSWEYQTHLALVSPKMLVGWLHEFGNRDLLTSSELLPFPIVWRYGGNEISRDRLYLGAGVTCALKHTLDLFFYYNSILAGEYSSSTVFGGLYKKF